MQSRWQTLFSAEVFTGAVTKTSGGLWVPDAESVDFEVTGSGSGTLSTCAVLFDPTQTATSLADSSGQASAPNLTSLPNTAAVSFDDVVGQTLTATAPFLGHVNFITTTGGVTTQGRCPYFYLYLQLTSSATVTVTVRARVKLPGDATQYINKTVVGSVV